MIKVRNTKTGQEREMTEIQLGLVGAPWVQIGAKQEAKTETVEESNEPKELKSIDYNGTDAVAEIKKLESKEEIESFTNGDTRAGVQKAIEKRLNELQDA